MNLLPYLTGKNDGTPHEILFWRLGPQWAVRQGDWKLVLPRDSSIRPTTPGPAGYVTLPKPMLFNLADDIGEQHDLAAEHPEKVQALQTAWNEWNAQLAEPGWTH